MRKWRNHFRFDSVAHQAECFPLKKQKPLKWFATARKHSTNLRLGRGGGGGVNTAE